MVGSDSTRARIRSPSSVTRLCPWSEPSSRSMPPASAAGAPSTRISRTAKTDGRRATAYSPTATARSAKPASSDRPDGSAAAGENPLRPPRGASAAATRVREALARGAATSARSPSAAGLLATKVERAQEADLVLQQHAESLARSVAGLGHEGDRVVGAGVVGVLDEVGVLGRDLRPADPVALQAARLQHPPRAELVVGILED